MDVTERFVQYRSQFAVAAAASVALLLLLYAAPRMLDVLAYFWPLFASTAAFLVLMIAFGGVSQFAADDAHGRNAGGGLIDYYAGRPDDNAADAHRY